MDNNELQHHGIKGMRWGVRRTDAQLARARGGSSAKKPAPPAAKKEPEKTTAPAATKKPSGEPMSNAELKARIERIKMERELKQLTAPQKSKGRQFVEDVLVNAGKQALTEFTKKKMSELLDAKFASKTEG